MIDPNPFAEAFFDSDGNIRMQGGEPVLKSASQLNAFIKRVPRDQLPNVTKLYQLKGIPAGITFAGASVVGDQSIKNLVDGFLTEPGFDQLKANAIREL